ncbi:L-aspartate oxidase [Nocardia iowensis]|uniref:FAD-binding protein n=1 Tax=Nocardia iowensis TaxID=204891 RepID=A0ABX8S056_NOCIO|nr:FAD-binding protein [Nocardia iowensis]QXN94617.1 FAD-binding protein [Nocardia iowensis]
MSRVIVAGSGGAGLAAAVEAADTGADVIVVTKALYRDSEYRWRSHGGCTWKTHAFNAAVSPDDRIADHVRDTIAGGAGANDVALVETLCQGAVELVPWLEGLGVPFEKDADGRFVTRPFGGCGRPRAVHLGDRLGFHIQSALTRRLFEHVATGRVAVLTGLRATELLSDDSGKVEGLVVVSVDTLQTHRVRGDAVVLADGGGASMYLPSAASADKTCDGIALGLRAGAEVVDMEFVQFHPTGIVSGVPPFDGSLVEEALRFDGATLRNHAGERFMFQYDVRGEMATRDIVSRGIFREMLRGAAFGEQGVDLDVSACRGIIHERYPAMDERVSQAGYDLARTPVLRVRPTAHFLMGGLRIGAEGATTINGLFAAGETAGGVHGANRLGGNGLAEALVFGRVAGASAARYVDTHGRRYGSYPIEAVQPLSVRSCPTGEFPSVVIHELGRRMYRNAGPVRTESGLRNMLDAIARFERRCDRLKFSTGARAAKQVEEYLDLRNLLLVSRVIVEAALLRRESRGAHYRDDFTETSPEYEGLAVTLKRGNLSWTQFSRAPEKASCAMLESIP